MYGCKECGAQLARDQKYCVSCGARRGGLPTRISNLIASLDVASPPTIAGVPPLALAPPTTAAAAGGLNGAIDAWLEDGTLPSPRVCAVAVMTLLAFGVILGSVVGATQSLSPVYVIPSAAQTAAVAPPATDAPTATADQSTTPAATTPAAQTPAAATPAASVKINHVWLIVLSNQGYAQTFGNTQSTAYLTNDLAGQGEVVPNYYAVAQGELANMDALVSGQGPTWQQVENCPNYTDLTPGSIDASTLQAQGDGCVFPNTVKSLPDAVAGAGKTARAYVESVDDGGSTTCRHPAAGAADPDFNSGGPYASWRNPLVYFHTITDDQSGCAITITGLGSLDTDLQNSSSPAFSLIVPNLCRDGSDTPCSPGAPAGLADSDSFLQDVVTKITTSKDYADGGLIAITFDQAPQGVPGADISGCCGQPTFPNLASPPPAAATPGATGQTGSTGSTGATGNTSSTGATGTSPAPNLLATASAAAAPSYVQTDPFGQPAGGGKVGLLLLSPFIEPGSTDASDSFNHYSLLLSIETMLGTEKLGYTAQPTTLGFPDGIFNKSAGGDG